MGKRRDRLLVFIIAACLLTVLIKTLRNPPSPQDPRFGGTKGAPMPFADLVFPSTFSPHKSELYRLLSLNLAFKRHRKYNKVRIASGKSTPDEGGHLTFKPHPLVIYDSSEKIDLALDKCAKIRQNATIHVNGKQSLDVDHCAMVQRFVNTLDRDDDPYLREFAPYLDQQMRLQIKHSVCHMHWFRLSGSSVFLKEYGYHLVISRLAYSPRSSRDNPQFSFSFAQLYTEDWKIANDVSLVVPTNDMSGPNFFVVDGQTYTVRDYPTIIPVPFFHDYGDSKLKYLGPEDPRMILVKNKKGYDEPLIVYNKNHVKSAKVDDDEDDVLVSQMTQYRSMWISWPWQFQKGKHNVDGQRNPKFDENLYNRAVELNIRGASRQSEQKNWTPFVSYSDRVTHGYDKTLMFVYRWSSLQILQCDLEGDPGLCAFAHRANKKLAITSGVGPLRGGTPLISLNELISVQTNLKAEEVIKPGREIWVGFARAHLEDCGCGHSFYRPNVVVLVRDTGGEQSFVLSHVSSSLSLNLEMLPWDRWKPNELCKGTNALIPNGISSWTVSKIKRKNDVWEFKDELTLAISMADHTVDVVAVRGLLSALAQLRDDLLIQESPVRKLMMHADANDNLVCAMNHSKGFCKAYGLMIYGDKRVENEGVVDKLEMELHSEEERAILYAEEVAGL